MQHQLLADSDGQAPAQVLEIGHGAPAKHAAAAFEQAGIETNPTTWAEFLETVPEVEEYWRHVAGLIDAAKPRDECGGVLISVRARHEAFARARRITA